MQEENTNLLASNLLYKIGSKKRVAHLLGMKHSSLGVIAQLLRSGKAEQYYSVRTTITGSKLRIIEEPMGTLRKIHDRLHDILNQIEKPAYLFSGKKGVCHLDVSRYHLGNTEFLTLDIRKFFSSVKREYVFRLFHHQLKNPADISWLLADLVCFRGRLPLGSPVSQDIAFLAFRTLFDTIAKKAGERNQKFSLYVDDMTFSSRDPIPAKLATEINYYLRRVDLGIHRGRTRIYRGNQYKVITGVAISPDQKLKVPNQLRRKISAMIRNKTWFEIYQGSETQTFIGRVAAARQIEPSFYVRTLRKLHTTPHFTPVSFQSSADSATSCPKISGKTASPKRRSYP